MVGENPSHNSSARKLSRYKEKALRPQPVIRFPSKCHVPTRSDSCVSSAEGKSMSPRSPFLPVIFCLSMYACCLHSQGTPSASQVINEQENLKAVSDQAHIAEPFAKVVGKANDVIVQEIRVRTVNGRMSVDYVLYNNRGRRDVINYRVRWLNSNGMTVTQYDPWETVALEGHEQSVLTIVAPVESATDFRFEIRPNQ